MIKYILTALLLAGTAWADAGPLASEQLGQCSKYTLCSAQTATGNCTVLPASGDEVVVRVASHRSLSFYSGQGVGAYSCDIYFNDEGHDVAGGIGQKMNSIALTTSQTVLSYEGAFDYVWVECTATGTQATVVVQSCKTNG